MSKNFNYQPDELFGRYCLIEQKRYGVPNEKFLYKVINTLNSNSWSDVPVDYCDKDRKLHDHCEQVVNVICCGVSEDKVERYRLCDVELLPNKLQSQLDQQKAMWNELKEWAKDLLKGCDLILDRQQINNDLYNRTISQKRIIINMLSKMQELEKGENNEN